MGSGARGEEGLPSGGWGVGTRKRQPAGLLLRPWRQAMSKVEVGFDDCCGCGLRDILCVL
jgi:hypothetical protein